MCIKLTILYYKPKTQYSWIDIAVYKTASNIISVKLAKIFM